MLAQADPITPISSGLLINKEMAHSSRLLVQNGPGVSLFLSVRIRGC
jgi:hypothetical protein